MDQQLKMRQTMSNHKEHQRTNPLLFLRASSAMRPAAKQEANGQQMAVEAHEALQV